MLQAAAAMAVGVGSFCDPPELQGLSHYLEHMLFMGSSKFPDENDYDAFLASHGGASNAYTELVARPPVRPPTPRALWGACVRYRERRVTNLSGSLCSKTRCRRRGAGCSPEVPSESLCVLTAMAAFPRPGTEQEGQPESKKSQIKLGLIVGQNWEPRRRRR